MKKLEQARKNLEEQRIWMRQHGTTLFGYMEHYWEDYSENQIREIYKADLDACTMYMNEVAHLEHKARTVR